MTAGRGSLSGGGTANPAFQAVILAAGRGSRLASETAAMPKALLPIGPRSLRDPQPTSFLRRQIEVLAELGVRDVLVVLGYRREVAQAELERWAPWVQIVVNDTPDITTSGSLHSFQIASRSSCGVLDGKRTTVMMDADIVYHRGVLARLLAQSATQSMMLVCSEVAADSEEVLVYGTAERPRFLGKGLTQLLADGAPCLGEATGIVSYAPGDHELVRQAMDWMLGDSGAPEGSARRRGFGPARRATEHEELAQRLMHHGRLRCLLFGAELPFMEVDSPEEYALLRQQIYPRILELEDGDSGASS